MSMKIKSLLQWVLSLILTALCFFFAISAQAQVDTYGIPRFIQLAPPTMLTNTPNTATAIFSNAPVDIHGYEGIATVIFSATNQPYSSSTKIYAYLEGSSDNVNWYTLTNFSKTTAATYNLTNSTTVWATNTYLLPGTIQTPTLGSAGFASPYLLPEPFTNSAVLLTNVNGGIAIMGFNIQDAPRYVHVAYTLSVAGAAYTTSAVIIARKHQGEFYY